MGPVQPRSCFSDCSHVMDFRTCGLRIFNTKTKISGSIDFMDNLEKCVLAEGERQKSFAVTVFECWRYDRAYSP